MRVLLFGAGGQVGGELARSLLGLAEVIAPARLEVDLVDFSAVKKAIIETRADVVINAAAFNDVDRAEEDEALATRVNGESVAAMGEAARETGALLVHYSTNFVFDGRASKPYEESDSPAPLSSYGRSKLLGEQRLRELDAPAIVLRTAWVYGLKRRSFVGSMLAAAREQEVLRVADDQVGSPTAARDLADATASLLERVGPRALAEARGVYHLAGAGEASKIDLVRAAIALDPRRNEHRVREVVGVSSASFGSAAPRPRYAPLSNALTYARFGVSLPPWRESLAHALAEAE